MAGHLHKMNVFHHQCVRLILGVTGKQQHVEHLTTIELAQRLGVDANVDHILWQQHLWLGHIACMTDDRIPKETLFGEQPASRPPHGPKKRWRDVIVSDLSACAIPVSSWFQHAADHSEWRNLCWSKPVEPPGPPPSFQCGCGRCFQKSGDLK